MKNDANSWSKRRFDWLSQIQSASNASRGSKQLASLICTKYVNRSTGQFWPKNRTLAQHMLVDVRTVQRYLAGLQSAGYLLKLPCSDRRRVFQLAFPDLPKGDKSIDVTMTAVSHVHVKTVTPYKRTTKTVNQNEHFVPAIPLSWKEVPFTETERIADWASWLRDQGFGEPDAVLALLSTPRGYALPSTYIEATDAAQKMYRQFYSMAIASKGAFLQ